MYDTPASELALCVALIRTLQVKIQAVNDSVQVYYLWLTVDFSLYYLSEHFKSVFKKIFYGDVKKQKMQQAIVLHFDIVEAMQHDVCFTTC